MDKINHWKKELEVLQKILNKTELTETIKWGTPVYTHKGKTLWGL